MCSKTLDSTSGASTFSDCMFVTPTCCCPSDFMWCKNFLTHPLHPLQWEYTRKAIGRYMKISLDHHGYCAACRYENQTGPIWAPCAERMGYPIWDPSASRGKKTDRHPLRIPVRVPWWMAYGTRAGTIWVLAATRLCKYITSLQWEYSIQICYLIQRSLYNAALKLDLLTQWAHNFSEHFTENRIFILFICNRISWPTFQCTIHWK